MILRTLKLVYWLMLLTILVGCSTFSDNVYREIDIQCADGTKIYSQWGQDSETKEVKTP